MGKEEIMSRSEAERLAERVTRVERILLAIALGIHNHKMDKGIDYFMISELPDTLATSEEVKRLLLEMQVDMERSFSTGQV